MGDDERAMNSKSGIRLRAILKPEETSLKIITPRFSSLEFSPTGGPWSSFDESSSLCLQRGSTEQPAEDSVTQARRPALCPMWLGAPMKEHRHFVNGNDDHHYFGLYRSRAKRMIKETPARNDG